jgi:hypothetical protein
MMKLRAHDLPGTRGRAASLVLAATFFAAAFAVSCTGTGRRTSSDEIRTGAASPDSVFRIFATGDARGHLEPCGCEQDQTGGLPRRGTYLAAASRPEDFVVDLGNLTSGKERLREARRNASFDALVQLRYDAFVPGPAETFDGEAFITAAAARPSVKVVCANWSRADGTLLFAPWVVLPASNGKRVAFVGVTEQFPDAAKEFVVEAPADAVKRAVRDLAGKSDAIVVGAAMSTSAAESLAREISGVAVVLVGATPEDTKWVAPATGARLEMAGELGGYVARVDLGPDLAVRDAWKAWLDDKTAEDAKMTVLVQQYRDLTASFDTNYVEGIIAAKRAERYAGSESCRDCHEAEHDLWRASLHSHGMRTLVEKKSSRDPDCVPCHLVDVGSDGTDVPADELGIGCEACHGGSASHVISARNSSGRPVQTPVRDAKAICTTCHHKPFVKEFAIETHWPRVEHGRSKK